METIKRHLNCKECGQIVSLLDETCPNCGAPLKSPAKKNSGESVFSLDGDNQKAAKRAKAIAAIDSIHQFLKLSYYFTLTILALFCILATAATGEAIVFFAYLIMAVFIAIIGKGVLNFIECVLSFFKVIVDMADDVSQIKNKINS